MPLTKLQAHQLFNVAGMIRDKVKEPRWLFVLLKLRKFLQAESDVFIEMLKPSPKTEEYDRKRVALCNESCVKDSHGMPLVQNNAFVIAPEKKASFDEKMKALQDEYKDLFAENDQKTKDVNALFATPSDTPEIPETHKLPLSCLSEGVTAEQIEVLMPALIDDFSAKASP